MTEPLDTETIVRQLHDRAEIHDVLMRYVRGVDRRDWDLVRSCYHVDAYQDHGAYAGDVDGLMEWSEAWHENIPVTMHTLSNIFIELNGDVAVAESYLIVQEMHHGETGPVYATAGCRYVDRFERRDDVGWRIARRIVPLVFTRPPDPAGDQPQITGALQSRRDSSDTIFSVRAEAGLS
jgi:ketosteroid isomerase-like protein